jgi:group I intron endonuclease
LKGGDVLKGIYQIRNIENNKVYIGSSMDVKIRWNAHKNTLNRNSHHSSKLQKDWNEYGEEAFVFEILEEIKEETKEELLAIEQEYINKHQAYISGYNMTQYASSLKKKYTLKKNNQTEITNMKGTIRKIGNSLGLILPSIFIKNMNLSNGSSVNMNWVDGNLIIGTGESKNQEILKTEEHKNNSVDVKETTFDGITIQINISRS